MSREYQSIDKSELEDFEAECRARGFNPAEFSLQEHGVTHTPEGSVIFRINGQVTITRNAASRTYSTGNASHWVIDFADDLKDGKFD